MNMGEEVSHLKAHVNTFYNNGALQRASEQPHLKTNQKPSQINKKVGSQEMLHSNEWLLLLFSRLPGQLSLRLARQGAQARALCNFILRRRR
ncbi:hypothetical protein [Ruegeria sp.]|uniref:hypothetical protein n=1 Tax=Ruegeria sp. TaxID=1879320 RepID=UPI003B00EE79